ncbi:MAG: lamin tail domain-containing protein, partial [Anaerolineales bacterium]
MRTPWPARTLRQASAFLGFTTLMLAQLGPTVSQRPILVQPAGDAAETPTPDPQLPTVAQTGSLTPTADLTSTFSPTPSLTPEEPAPIPSPTASLTPTATGEELTPTITQTATSTPTGSETPTATSTPTPDSPVPPQAILINEIAWAGTLASANDEWIELHNPGPDPIDLTGWRLSDGGDVNVALVGSIPPFSYFLLERTDETTVSDLAADFIYTGSLRNTGEHLELLGPVGEIIDTANSSGGGWPAGDASSRASMERRGGGDLPGNWATFTGYFGNGLDAAGHLIQGTPRRTNSLTYPTPTPTGIPSRVVINEVLIRPRHDWEGTGGVTTADEFIELYNAGPMDVYLKGWWLDDSSGGGSNPFDLPGVTIPAHGYVVFFRTQTKIALNDTGDTVRLLAPDEQVIDEITYLSVRAANLSFGRLPDGSDHLSYGLWPTPRQPNLLFEEPIPDRPSGPFFLYVCPGAAWPAGSKELRGSMERLALEDTPASWMTFPGPPGEALDAEGGPISGTPRRPNSVAIDSAGLADQSRPSVLINEVAWSGTAASASDEWIELHNPGQTDVDLRGWLLTDRDDLNVALVGTIGAGGYFLLERTDDATISNLPADLLYTGGLRDQGE